MTNLSLSNRIFRMIRSDMKRTIKDYLVLLPWILVLVLGFATGCAMAGLGLAVRLQNALPPDGPAAWFGLKFFEAAGISAGRIGWMLVLEGTFLIAALCAFAVRNHWGWWSTAAAGLIAMIFFPGGTLAGILVLAALGVRLISEKFGKRGKEAATPAKSQPVK